MGTLSIASLRSLPLPILVIGNDETVSFANEPMRAILGYDPSQWHYGRVLRQPRLLDLIERSLAQESTETDQVRFRIDGQDTLFRAFAGPAELDDGTGVLLTLEDQTSQEASGRARKDFVANVSHELRTPLTAIMGYIETMRGPARDDREASDRFLELAQNEAERMNRLVGDLLSLSAVEAEERVRPTTPVDLSEVLGAAVSALGKQLSDNDARVDISGIEPGIMVPAVSDQLVQVFLNLIENAVRYGATEVAVETCDNDPFATAIGGNSVCIAVRDNGQGIAEHHLPRLTERFYRVDEHRSRQIGGTGLGLAIVKHIINRHRGRMKIESVLDNGTAIFIALPQV